MNDLFLTQHKNYASPWMSAKELSKIVNICDMIEINRGAYKHWAIMEDDNDKIIHFSGNHDNIGIYNWSGRPFKIIRGSLIETVGIFSARINNLRDSDYERYHKPLDTCNEMLDRARERIDTSSYADYADGKRKSYNVAFNNCEHFVTYCRYGIAFPGQSTLLHQLLFEIHPLPITLSAEVKKWARDVKIMPFDEKTPEIIIEKTNISDKLMEFLVSKTENFQIFALYIFSNIAKYRNYNDYLTKSGILEGIADKCFTKPIDRILIHKEALRIIACIAAIGNDDQKQALIPQIIPAVIRLLDSRDIMTVTLCVLIITCFSCEAIEQARTITGAIPKLNKLLNMQKYSKDICEYTLKLFYYIASYQEFHPELIGSLKNIGYCLDYSYDDIQQMTLQVIGMVAIDLEESTMSGIDENVVRKIIIFLDSKNPETVYLAARALEKIAYGIKERTPTIIGLASIRKLTNLLSSKNEIVCYGCICALGQIGYYMNDTKFLTEPVMFINLEKFFKHSNTDIQIRALNLIHLICNGDQKEKQSIINSNIIPSIATAFACDNLKVVKCSIYVLENITRLSKEHAKAVLDSGAISVIIGMLLSSETPEYIFCHSLIILKHITYHQDFNDELINTYRFMDGIVKCSTSAFLNIQEKVVWVVNNIAAGPVNLKQAVIDAQLVPFIIGRLCADNSDTTNVGLMALRNIANGTEEQLQAIVAVIPNLTNLFSSTNDNICENVLYILTKFAHTRIFDAALVNSDVLKTINGFKNHQNVNIRRDALKLINEIAAADEPQKQAIIDAKLIPSIVDSISSNDTDVVKISILILANIALKRREQALAVVHAGGLRKIMELLHSPVYGYTCHAALGAFRQWSST